MKDLELIKQELRADLLGEGYWGDLAKKVGTQLRNYAFTGNSKTAPKWAKTPPATPPPIPTGGSQLYQQIKTASQQFSSKFVADFKKIAATLKDNNLTAYADKFAQVALTEMMTNPAKAGSQPKTTAPAAPAAPAPSATGSKKGSKPASKQPMPPEFINLKKSVTDFIMSLATMVGVKATKATDALQGVLMSNQMSEEEKKKLKVFVQKHLQVIKYLRDKLNKQAAKPASPAPTASTAPKKTKKKAAPTATSPATLTGSGKGDSGDYSIEEGAGQAIELIPTGGEDDWSRPIYKDHDGNVYVDINLGQGKPSIHTVTDSGEPLSPVRNYTIAAGSSPARHANALCPRCKNSKPELMTQYPDGTATCNFCHWSNAKSSVSEKEESSPDFPTGWENDKKKWLGSWGKDKKDNKDEYPPEKDDFPTGWN